MTTNTRSIAFIIFLLLMANIDAQNITGQWKSIDEETGIPTSIVELFIEDGKLYGEIRQLIGTDEAYTCQCSGDKANLPIIGLRIIDGLSQSKHYWKKDKGIFDPLRDTYYDVRIWQKNDKLIIRGYIGIFYRTQVWLRAKSDDFIINK